MDILSTALPALGDAFSLISQPQHLLYLILGVLLGLSVGVFPGLGGIAGLSLVLPFVYGMDPISGLALMVGLVAVIPTSDTFASVLMGIPGSSASQATVLDGFPLAKKGEAARALSAAFASSLFGGLFGATILTFFILIARPLVLAFGLPEMLMVTILGLSMVAILAGRIPLKGLAAAGLGLMVGTIGAADAGGAPRMSGYDWDYLYDGLKLVIVGLGIFAIPEIISLLRQDRSISRDASLGAGWLDGVKDWWQNIWLSIRCATIGVIVGVIPGLGGSVVDWIAYGHTVQTTKDKSMFGQGDIRGVIGPESSNNAKEGGGLVPTLIFGIPGSGSMAIFIGGMALLGYEAGPQLITNDLNITYTIVWSLALANVVGAGLCIALSGGIARLTTIRFTLLAPFLFMLIAFAAFRLVAAGIPDRIRSLQPDGKLQLSSLSGRKLQVSQGNGSGLGLHFHANRTGPYRDYGGIGCARDPPGKGHPSGGRGQVRRQTRATRVSLGRDDLHGRQFRRRHDDRSDHRHDLSGDHFRYIPCCLPHPPGGHDAGAGDGSDFFRP